MLTFTVHGPCPVPYYAGKAARVITRDDRTEFWKHTRSMLDRRGCYLFAVRTGRGITPLYVGRTRNTFGNEVFQPEKLAKYQHGLADYRRGFPVLLFIAAEVRRGAPNAALIKELEAFLIQTAVSKNNDLLNVHGTKRADWRNLWCC